MRTIKYKRTELHAPDEDLENDLLVFVYDIPSLTCCGILPHCRLLNQFFMGGGGDGGMGPGAIWEPFEITRTEFNELAALIDTTPPRDLATKARYCEVQWAFDPQFDGILDRARWMEVVSLKHREAYQQGRGHSK
jgi:hypothetical protein